MVQRSAVKVERETDGQGAWIDRIHAAVGGYVNLETSDGIQRNGRLTGIRSNTIRMNGEAVTIISQMELNGDPTDLVDVWRLARIDIEAGA